MMKKILLVGAIVCSLVGNAFAASDPCKDKVAEAKKLAAKCKSIGKGNSGYEQCINSYKVLKNQAEQACRSGGLDENGMREAIAQWERKVNNCRGRQDARCASALQQLGHYQFQLEEKLFLDKTAQYEEDVARCAARTNKPAKCANIDQLPKPDHKKSLGYFLEFLDKYPRENKTPTVMYQAAAILEASGEDEKAFKLRERLIKNFPDNGLVPKTWLRIAEYYFMNRKFRDAIAAYKKVTGFENLTGKEAALAMYHLAESYYDIAEYETAAIKYYEYIVGADKGKYPADLRPEAMDFMVAAYSKIEGGGLNEAKSFLNGKNVAFKDSVYKKLQKRLKKGQEKEAGTQAEKRNRGVTPPSEEWEKPTILKDSRDGRSYKIVEIGEQIWMAENLSYKTEKSRCYNDDEDLCKENGRLYNWREAVQACPAGWRLPTSNDFVQLKKYIYKEHSADVQDMDSIADYLKSRNGWKGRDANGWDTYGFNAIPAGYYGYKGKGVTFEDMGGGAYFWTATYPNTSSYVVGDGHIHTGSEGEPSDPVHWHLYNDSKFFLSNQSNAENSLHSVRCIKAESGDVYVSGNRLLTKDERDGKEYSVTVVGDHYWFAENLAYDTENSWYLFNDASNASMGKFYDWNYTENVCPQGWDLPLSETVESLILDYLDGKSRAGKQLRQYVEWPFEFGAEMAWNNGDNAFDLSFIPNGYISDDEKFTGTYSAAIYAVKGRIKRAGQLKPMLFWVEGGADSVSMGTLIDIKGVTIRCVRPINPELEKRRLIEEAKFGFKRLSPLDVHRHLLKKSSYRGSSSGEPQKSQGNQLKNPSTGAVYDFDF